MKQTALITGADRGLGLGFCQSLLEKGWSVIAGQYNPQWKELEGLKSEYHDQLMILPLDVSSSISVEEASRSVRSHFDSIDLLINNAALQAVDRDREIHESQNYAEMMKLFDVNSLGPLRVVEHFLSLVGAGHMKRLCFISSEAGSIEASRREGWYGYCMSKAALNMAVKNMFNNLRPKDYTFRLYHPGWIQSYMEGELCKEADFSPVEAAEMALQFFLSPLEDENQLHLTDFNGEVWPW